MSLFAAVCACFICICSSSTPVTQYDQRQTGETNIRVDLKDVSVILMDSYLSDYGDYNYDYDYSDLTVKPEVGNASTEATVTNAVNATEATATGNATEATATGNATEASVNTNATSTASPTANQTVPPSSVVEHLPGEEYHIPVIVIQDKQEENNGGNGGGDKINKKKYVNSSDIRKKKNPESQEQPSRNCAPGFFLDNQNRCKKIRRQGYQHQKERPKLPHLISHITNIGFQKAKPSSTSSKKFGLRFPQLALGRTHEHDALKKKE